jgi:hypothetical protein
MSQLDREEKNKEKDNRKKNRSDKNLNESGKKRNNTKSSDKTFMKEIHKNPDDYRGRIDYLSKIDSSKFPEGFKPKILYKNPYIVKLRRFLNSDEITAMLNMADGKFGRSTIVVDGEMVYSNVRTSETAFITESGHYEEYSKPIKQVLDKVCYLVGCKKEQIEGLMVVKYVDGEEYYNHHDYFKPEHTDIIADGGQRIATFFCYLTSLRDDEGGETEFPLIKLKSRPSRGTALFWWNTDSDGRLLYKTLHRGNPVKSKDRIKYGLNIWIRDGVFKR